MNKKQLLILPALFLSLLIGSTACFKMNNADLIRRAEQGDASAQLKLAIKYYYGERDGQQTSWPTSKEGEYYLGKYQNYKKAAKWYRLAAEQGNTRAQTMLCVMYYHGEGVTKNYEETVKWCRLAAERGDAKAQSYLGWMHKEGLGVPQDYREALKWFHLAAEQGRSDAQFNLGWMYKEGNGITKDYIRAYMWMILSIKNGGSASFARKRDSLIKEMTPTQIEEAKKRARDCETESYKNC